MELISDYNCTINHYPGHAIVVGNVLKRQPSSPWEVSTSNLIELRKWKLNKKWKWWSLIGSFSGSTCTRWADLFGSTEQYVEWRFIEWAVSGSRQDLKVRRDEAHIFENRLYIPEDKELMKEILDEVHISAKCCASWFNQDVLHYLAFLLLVEYEREMAEYVRRWFVCQQVKAERWEPSKIISISSYP